MCTAKSSSEIYMDYELCDQYVTSQRIFPASNDVMLSPISSVTLATMLSCRLICYNNSITSKRIRILIAKLDMTSEQLLERTSHIMSASLLCDTAARVMSLACVEQQQHIECHRRHHFSSVSERQSAKVSVVYCSL